MSLPELSTYVNTVEAANMPVLSWFWFAGIELFAGVQD
jgi:hypothetical protein